MGRLTNAETTALTACSYILDGLRDVASGKPQRINFQELDNVQKAVDALLNAPPPGPITPANEGVGV